MTFNVDVNRKAIQRDVKLAACALGGIIALRVTAGVAAAVRDAKQAKEIKRLKKQVQDLEERLALLESRQNG